MEVVEGGLNNLLWDLMLYRHAMQWVVDALRDLSEAPSMNNETRGRGRKTNEGMKKTNN